MSRSKAKFGSPVSNWHCPAGGVSVALLAMVLMATAGGLGPATIARPVAGPQVLSVLALSAHHPAISLGDLENDRPDGVEAVRVVQPDLIHLESLRMGSQRLNLPPPQA